MDENKYLEKKHQYIRDVILDKNYDIDEFDDFVNKYKENVKDIKNLRFFELIKHHKL